MESKERSPRAVFKVLRRKLRKRETLRARVEKATVRLERRRNKLHKLEVRIADLERRTSTPQNDGGSRSRGGVRKWRTLARTHAALDDFLATRARVRAALDELLA